MNDDVKNVKENEKEEAPTCLHGFTQDCSVPGKKKNYLIRRRLTI